MTPQDLITDLNRVRTFRDNRILIWYCNLYIEHLVKLIYKKYKSDIKFGNCSTCGKSQEPTFLSKVDELSAASLIDVANTHDEIIKRVYKSRNTAGHELIFNENDISKKIIETLSKATKVDPYGVITKTLQNTASWKQFEIAVVAVVARLYERHEEMDNREVTKKLIFKTNENHTEIWPEIVSKDDPNYQSP